MPGAGQSARVQSQAIHARWPDRLRRMLRVALLVACVLLVATPVAARTSDHIRIAGSTGLSDLEAMERAFGRVVAEVSPSVVGIRAERNNASHGLAADGLDQRYIVNGSGTIVSEDGLILTNEHVVQNATSIEVLLHDGQKYRAQLHASDPRSDLAVLKIKRTGLQPARRCDWSRVRRGQWIIAIGNPFGLGFDGQLSVSVGIVANLGRQLPGLGEVDDRFYNNMIQVTAPINPGNSGGPIFNLRGEFVGVVTAMHTRAPADEGIGFAIPMTPVKHRVVETLCLGREVQYGYIGITVRAPDDEERAKLSSATGVVVQQVEPDGPAAQAGIRIGDFVTAFEHQPVNGPSHLAELAGQAPVGSVIRLDLQRGNRATTVNIVVERRNVSRVSWMRSGTIRWRGLRLADVSAPDVRKGMRVTDAERGVIVVEIESGSPASSTALSVGDIIQNVGGTRVDDTIDFLLRVREADGALQIELRNGTTHRIEPHP